jgi:hypothetical protein
MCHEYESIRLWHASPIVRGVDLPLLRIAGKVASTVSNSRCRYIKNPHLDGGCGFFLSVLFKSLTTTSFINMRNKKTRLLKGGFFVNSLRWAEAHHSYQSRGD